MRYYLSIVPCGEPKGCMAQIGNLRSNLKRQCVAYVFTSGGFVKCVYPTFLFPHCRHTLLL